MGEILPTTANLTGSTCKVACRAKPASVCWTSTLPEQGYTLTATGRKHLCRAAGSVVQGLISQKVLLQPEAPAASTPTAGPHLPQDKLLVSCVSSSSPHQEGDVQPGPGQALPGALSLQSQCSLSCSSWSLAYGISLCPTLHPGSSTSGRMGSSSLRPPPCQSGRCVSPAGVMSFAGTEAIPAPTHPAV